MTGIGRAPLAAALRAWLPGRRWFPKDRALRSVDVLDAVPLGGDGGPDDPVLLHCLVAADLDGTREHYQVPLGLCRDLPDDLVPHRVAEVGGTAVYDATGDPRLAGRLLDLVAGGGAVGALRFGTEPGVSLRTGLPARPIGVEQSNTSLVYGRDYILKLYRRPAPGTHPDLELHRALAAAGSRHVAAPLGSVHGVLAGQPVLLGFLQRFLPDAPDGWALATAAARADADFTAEARALGRAVAETHADLRTAFGSVAGGPDRVADLVAGLRRGLAEVRAAVPALERYAPAISAAYDRVADLPGVALQRVHGDLHLGQVLRSGDDWVLIDFEGEPAAPLAERAAPRPALRDVAGVLRSFDYAAHHAGAGWGWAERCRAAFRAGYAEAGSGPPAEGVLLRALELQKAVYEVGYEHTNRPDWLPVPLDSIGRAAGVEEEA
ncbi:maltokinase N-terminal cap-like domain-containing protein [Actinosynnema sp. CS-041913]|uniref:maltokinase N-terminal cap-like domain-containing protein n=1 Tax=Actinosynnema sp. CS-041913 TaxID=3239917 RepID=UPI003D9230EE